MLFLQKLGSFLGRLGLDKGDERSILIAFYATRIAWIFTTIALFIWAFHGLINNERLRIEALILFSSQLVFWFSYLYYRKKFGG